LIRSDYDDAQPSGDRNLSTNSFLDFLKNKFWKNHADVSNWFNEFVYTLTHLADRHPNSFIKVKSGNIEDNVTTRLLYYLYRLLAFNKRNNLKNQYDNLSTIPNLELDFVYLNLHYQPEKTTSPDAGHFVHQYLVANLLSKSLPDHVNLYIKEHPAQFSADRFGEQGRRSRYYIDLLKLGNVKLVSMSMDQFKLIDKSTAVATINGTVGWESLVRGTPVLTFGQPWYADCPGCYTIETKRDICRILNQITTQEKLDFSDVLEFAGLVESKSLNFEPDIDNAKILAELIAEKIEFIH
jgi:hypothetical protein